MIIIQVLNILAIASARMLMPMHDNKSESIFFLR
nr:MAG TPA: hypothetical protein [Caudoviricetes sp.]